MGEVVQTIDGIVGRVRAVSVGGLIYVNTRWYERADVKCLACTENNRCSACEKELSTSSGTYTA